MQFRDKKTLFIDVFFPIFLIIVGLELATIAVIKPGKDKNMMPSELYKGDGIINKFYYNQNSGNSSLDLTTAQDFMNDIASVNTTMFPVS